MGDECDLNRQLDVRESLERYREDLWIDGHLYNTHPPNRARRNLGRWSLVGYFGVTMNATAHLVADCQQHELHEEERERDQAPRIGAGRCPKDRRAPWALDLTLD